MTGKNRKIVQLTLISIGFFLILATYFYPKINEGKLKDTIVKENEVDTVEIEDVTEDVKDNVFKNVSYKGFYNFDKPFTVKSEKAHILADDPNLVYMTRMNVVMRINNERVVTITSDKGRYNKITFDCYFEDNVRATDGKNIILSENLDLLTNEDAATAYNRVFLSNPEGSLRADKIVYNFETKSYRISMFDDRKVKIKLIK